MHLSAEDATAVSRARISRSDAGPALSLSIPRAARADNPETVIAPLGMENQERAVQDGVHESGRRVRKRT